MALYRCNGAGAEKPTLLWTNSSPKTAFGAQDVALDLSNYSAVMIENKSQMEETVYGKSIFEKNSNTHCMGLKSTNYGAVIRQFNIYDDKISFKVGYYNSTSASGAVCVPTRIWGYKKINFPS